jgi:hypothetical protein
MFGWRREISNLECDIVAVKGLLKGLNNHLTALIRISNDPEYRGDLTDEIKRVRLEIEENENKLNELTLRLNPPSI